MNHLLRNKTTPLFIGMLFVACYVIVTILNFKTIPPTLTPASSFSSMASWHTVVSTFDNGVISYREDPLLTYLLSAVEPSTKTLFIIKTVILSIGLYLFLAAQSASVLVVPALITTIIALFGESHLLITHLMWAPWLGWALINQRISSPIRILVCFFLTVRISQCCGELSLLITGLIWLITRPQSKLHNPLLILLLFTLPVLSLFGPSANIIAHYPTDARLIPDDALPEPLLPFFSSSFGIASLNKMFIKEALKNVVILLTVITIILTITLRSYPHALALLLSALLFLDIIPCEGRAQTLPLASFNRLYPGLYHFSAAPLLIGAILFSIGTGTFGAPIIAGLALVTSIQALSHHQVPYSLGASKLSQFNHALSIPAARKHLISPSFYSLYDHNFEYPLVEHQHFEKLRLWNIPHQIITSANNKDASLMADDDGATRWATLSGKQSGKDWVLLKFTKTIPTLSGILIDAGVYFSDYPRGLRIQAAQTCTGRDDGDFSTLAHHPRWEGSLLTTRRGHYHYFEPRHHAKVYFKTPTTAACYLIEATGVSHSYDWSIASLILFESSQKQHH